MSCDDATEALFDAMLVAATNDTPLTGASVDALGGSGGGPAGQPPCAPRASGLRAWLLPHSPLHVRVHRCGCDLVRLSSDCLLTACRPR